MHECNRNCEGHKIAARIWEQFGSPSYAELAGRSIHDLIDERAATIAAQAE